MSKSAYIRAVAVGLGFWIGVGIAQAEGAKDVLGGKTLTSPKGKTVYILYLDGALGGKIAKKDVVGSWEINDDQWCRTIVEPKDYEGHACRILQIEGDQVTLSGNGQSVLYTMK